MNWKNRKILVTGACGFIGSHLVEELVRVGAHPTAMVLYNARGGNGMLDTLPAGILGKMNIVPGDVRDTEFVNSVVKPDSIVFHLAALIGIPYSYAAPRSYVDTNITGTLNVLNACRLKHAARVLTISTSEVYGTAIEVPINERHPLQGQSPYSATKIAAEKLTESYHLAFGLPATVVRPFNTYGPRQSARAVIPTIIIQLISGRTKLSLGDTTTTRDFCFVKDTARGMMEIAASPGTIGKTVNIGTGRDVSIRAVIDLLARITGTKVSVRSDRKRFRPARSEVRRLCADATLLKKLTGWSPGTRLEDGLRTTVEWFRNHPGFDAERYYV